MSWRVGVMMNETGVRPIKDHVLVRRDAPQAVTTGGLHVPQGAEHWPTTGTVLAVGSTVKECQIAVGARVFFTSRPTSALIRDDREPGERAHKQWERVVVLREEDIVGILLEDG